MLAGEKGLVIGWTTKFVYMDDSGHLYGSLPVSYTHLTLPTSDLV